MPVHVVRSTIDACNAAGRSACAGCRVPRTAAARTGLAQESAEHEQHFVGHLVSEQLTLIACLVEQLRLEVDASLEVVDASGRLTTHECGSCSRVQQPSASASSAAICTPYGNKSSDKSILAYFLKKNIENIFIKRPNMNN